MKSPFKDSSRVGVDRYTDPQKEVLLTEMPGKTKSTYRGIDVERIRPFLEYVSTVHSPGCRTQMYSDVHCDCLSAQAKALLEEIG